MARVQRDSARVVTIDDDGRVLLQRVVDPMTGRAIWIVPGGGIEPGEMPLECAVRELWEETGLSLEAASLVGPVATTSGPWDFRGVEYQSTDWYFVHRCSAFEPCAMEITEIESELEVEWRWVAADEVDQLADVVIPANLTHLVRSVLAGEAFPTPVELPWVSG